MANNYYSIQGSNSAVDSRYPTYDDAIIGEIKIKHSSPRLQKQSDGELLNQTSNKYNSFRSIEQERYGPEVVNNSINKSLDVYGYESGSKGSKRNINLYDHVSVQGNFKVSNSSVLLGDVNMNKNLNVANNIIAKKTITGRDIYATEKIGGKTVVGTNVIGTHISAEDIKLQNGSMIKDDRKLNQLQIHGVGTKNGNKNITLYDNVNVTRALQVGNDLDVKGSGKFNDNLYANKDASIKNNLNVMNNLYANKDASIKNNLNVMNNLDVKGSTNMNSLNVTKNLNVNGSINSSIFLGKTIVGNQLCAGNICMNESNLQTLLTKNGINPTRHNTAIPLPNQVQVQVSSQVPNTLNKQLLINTLNAANASASALEKNTIRPLVKIASSPVVNNKNLADEINKILQKTSNPSVKSNLQKAIAMLK